MRALSRSATRPRIVCAPGNAGISAHADVRNVSATDPNEIVRLAREETVTMVIQVNGKVRDRIEVSADITVDEAERLALSSEKIQNWIDGQTVDRVIARPPNLVNLVAG